MSHDLTAGAGWDVVGTVDAGGSDTGNGGDEGESDEREGVHCLCFVGSEMMERIGLYTPSGAP